MLIHFLAAAVGTVAFALIFDVPPRFYGLCALIGGLGFLAVDVLEALGLSATEATFFAAALVTLGSRICAVWRRCPVTVFLISGIIPLVPGAGIYWTAYYLVMDSTSEALSRGFAAIRAAVAIVLGIVLTLEIPNRLFHLRRKGPAPAGGPSPVPGGAQREDADMSVEKIWNIADTDNLLVALSDRVAKKCEYGDHMDALSPAERIFFVTQTCEMEVNNGGFAQFFDNSGGGLAGETVGAFQAIGAVKTAEICRRALDAFGREERRALLDAPAGGEIDQALGECDAAFFRYEEDLSALNYDFVMKNRADFS